MAQSRTYQNASGNTYSFNYSDQESLPSRDICSSNMRSRRTNDLTEEEQEYYETLNEKKRRIRAARARKARIRRRKRTAAVITAILAVSMVILLTTAIHTFASSENEQDKFVYYTTVTVEKGDTLWNLAEDYYNTTDMTRKEYMQEICQMNNVIGDTIKPGDSLTMFYYSDELK